jgi:hypothetical protein
MASVVRRLEVMRTFAKHLARWKSRTLHVPVDWLLCHVFSQDPAELSEGVWVFLNECGVYCRALVTTPVP